MKRHAWVLVGACLLVLCVSPASSSAQQPASDAKAGVMETVQLTRTVVANERQAIITQAMDLTSEEMQGFWPLYRQYRLEVASMGDRVVALISAFGDAYENMSNDTADKLLAEFVSIEKERAHIKAKYLPKFKKVMPAKKVVRFYQLENKLDTVVLAEFAEHIPLSR